jgi:hypothetical protein
LTLFNFQLRALADVIPWGSAERPHLHWFGLTDGWYWLQMSEREEFFRYSPALLAHWHRQHPEKPLTIPYVDYYVVRLWEDILNMLSDILEPLPPRLAQMLETDEQLRRWQEQVRRWRDEIELDDEDRDTLSQAITWWEHRMLDTGYLTANPHIWFWSDGRAIHCFWDNRQLCIKDLPAWEAQRGRIQLPLAPFLDEVNDFHTRLIAAMAERIQEAKSFPFPPDLELDMAALEKEQQDRATWLAKRLEQARSRSLTEWDIVIDAIMRLEKRFGSPSDRL